jgi:hypothetical protein
VSEIMTIPVITAAPVNSPSPPPGPAEPAVRQISVLLTTIVAGAAGCLIAYWTWRMVLRLPLAVAPGSGLSGAAVVADNDPWAPWWVPSAIVGGVAMVLWPILAAHARRISLLGGSAAIVLVSILIFPVAAVCVELASLTRDGWPPVLEFIGAMPRVLGEAVNVTFVNLMYSGVITIPLAALIGLLLAAFGRLVGRTVDWLSRMRAG